MKLLFLLPFLIFGQIGTVHHNFNWLNDSMRIDSIKTRSIYSDNYYNIDTADVDNLSLYLGQKLNVSDSSDLARKVHVHDTSDVNSLSLYLGQKLDVTDTSGLARKIHGDRHLPGGPDDFFPSGTGGFLHYGDGVAQPASWEWRYPAVADVTGLQTALNGKLDVSDTTNFVWDSELNDYYTKTNLSTSGESSVHAGNITNAPW